MELKINLVGNATWVIDIDNKFKIGCDPSLAPSGTKYIYKGLKTSRVKDAVYNDSTFNNTKLWILTHSHFDHIDKQGLDIIGNSVKVIARENCEKILRDRSDLDVNYLKWDDSKTIQINDYKIDIKAIPAIHGMNFLAKILMGGVNGYLIKVSYGKEHKTIYVTSDTVFNEDIIDSIDNEKIDVLIANMGQAKEKMLGGPFTMNTDMLTKFIKVLNPRLTLPIHIDDFEHFSTSRTQLKKLEGEGLIVLENGESINI